MVRHPMSLGDKRHGCGVWREAAEILAVSTKTVRRYIAAGELDAVRLGRRTIRIKVESLDRLIDAHPVKTCYHRSA